MLLLPLLVEGRADLASDAITFEQHIRPILKANCFQCHGEEAKPKAGLDLRLPSFMKKGGHDGPVLVAGKLEQSRLWERIDADAMPPGKKKLTAHDKALIKQWIAGGAKTRRPEPSDPNALAITEEDRHHWAFQPIRPPAPPLVPARYHLANHIDAFIAARLQQHHLSFSPEADRRTLLRRVTFDLTGLPPTPEEINAFLKDTAAGAYERLVDRLLNSPHYGERWGRHWLDVAGYSESEGTPGDEGLRPYAWKYRDYVIKSFNDDKPFDQFVREQLAGDEMVRQPFDRHDARVQEKLIATGFLRMAPDGTQADNSLTERNQAVAETIKIVSSSLLGLTVGCAQCHDHRYDPISQRDYFRFRAIFDPALDMQAWKQPKQRLFDVTDEPTQKKAAEIEAEAKKKDEAIQADMDKLAKQIFDRELNKVPDAERSAAQAAIETAAAKRTPEQLAILKKYPNVKEISFIRGFFVEYDPPAHKQFEARKAEVAKFRATKPPTDALHCLIEPPGHLPTSRMHHRGDPTQLKAEVTPGELTILAFHRPAADLPLKNPTLPTTGRRLALAQRLTDGTHPLLARVIVNRVWLQHFGRGLVNTPGDFGLLGEKPSHPELLDWLASDFMQHGWTLKRLHKLILLSTTYRQSSRRTPELDRLDPDNRFLARMNLRRLEAEAVRDALLAVSGELKTDLYGPSVPVTEDQDGRAVLGERVLRSDGLFDGALKPAGERAARRSLYIQARRRLPLHQLETFDFPVMTPNCEVRRCSTVVPQALFFLNDHQLLKRADALAERLMKDQPNHTLGQIRHAYLLLFATEPSQHDLKACQSFLADQLQHFERRATDKPTKQKQATTPPDKLALASLCQTLMSSNRFLYVD
jgi:hypothetical protein